MQPLQILIADSRDEVRRRVRSRLEKQTGWKVCGEAATGPDAVARTIELGPDIVLLDEGLPGLSGEEIAQELSRVAPAALVLTLALFAPPRGRSDEEIGRPVAGPAAGHLVDAIKTLVDPSPAVARRHDDNRTAGGDRRAGSQGAADGERRLPLTSREREVLQLLADGRSNKEIGVLLTISTRTVETHRARVMRKLGLHSMNQLVRYAIRHRIIRA